MANIIGFFKKNGMSIAYRLLDVNPLPNDCIFFLHYVNISTYLSYSSFWFARI